MSKMQIKPKHLYVSLSGSSPVRSRGSHASDPALKATTSGGTWGSIRQHAQGSQQHLLAPPSPHGLELPLASGTAASSAPPVIDTGSLAGRSTGSTSKRTPRENVVRCVVTSDASCTRLSVEALDDPALLETYVWNLLLPCLPVRFIYAVSACLPACLSACSTDAATFSRARSNNYKIKQMSGRRW